MIVNERKGKAALRCPNCGNKIGDGNRYCTKCWTESVQKTEHIPNEITEGQENYFGSKVIRFFTVWITDIEVNKVAYNALFCLLILGITLVNQPILEITSAVGDTSIAIADIEGLSWINTGVVVLSIISFACLLMPNLVPLEWKLKWIMPATITSALECGVIIYLLVKIDDMMGTILDDMMDAILNILLVEVHLTASGWALIVTCALTLVCAIKVIWDIYNNCNYS